MKIRYNVTGAERKRLVQIIAAATGAKATYLGMPTAAYEIGCFKVDKEGTLIFYIHADTKTEEIQKVLDAIAAAGFTGEGYTQEDAVREDEPKDTGLTVGLPAEMPDPDGIERLEKLIESKASLIRKALNTDRLTVEVENGKIEFHWWDAMPDPDEVSAYGAFICALVKMAREATRVNGSEREVPNEKYAFRCFLLRLGFIGEKHKEHRKILLKRLSGSAAFRDGAKKDGN